MENKYDSLKSQYPEFISIDQFRKICHIARRSAAYLLKHGIVPCEDTGKETWKYKIRLADVIAYLVLRDKEGSQIPCGAVTNQYRKKSLPKSNEPNRFIDLIIPKEAKLIKQYFEHEYPDCPDLLVPRQIAEMTGLGVMRIREMIKLGQLRAIEHNKMYRIPKSYFFRFLTTSAFYKAKSPSTSFKKVLVSFESWKNQTL